MTTYAIPEYYQQPEATGPATLQFVPRWRYQWVPLLVPIMFCGVSWLANGIPAFTDIGFLLFTLLAMVYALSELLAFPRRFGIGGLLLWGGVLIWFSHDYFSNWFNHDYSSIGGNKDIMVMPAWVIAKAAFLHVTFVTIMSIGLNWNVGRWMEKLFLCIPDPGDNRFYAYLVIFMFAFGVSPYFLFNAEPCYLCIYHALFAGWTGPPQFTVFRTGNLNYNWGGYVAQIMEVGFVGGIVAIVYAILIAKSWAGRLMGFTVWWFSAMVAFESGRRGQIVFIFLPPIALLFIKFQSQSAELFRQFSVKSYFVCGLLLLFMLFIVQFQGKFRTIGYGAGYANVDVTTVNLTKSQGNTMFSEGLLGYQMVGETVPFFYDKNVPGEGFIRAIPQTVFDFLTGPIPRALWHDKPVDGLWAWYNKTYMGSSGDGTGGTTISHGLVGSWYFKFGPAGIIEGALLVGWLMGVSERALQHSEGRPTGILMSLGVATWLFRCFRDFKFNDLYTLLVGAVFLYFAIPLLRPLFGGKTQ